MLRRICTDFEIQYYKVADDEFQYRLSKTEVNGWSWWQHQ